MNSRSTTSDRENAYLQWNFETPKIEAPPSYFQVFETETPKCQPPPYQYQSPSTSANDTDSTIAVDQFPNDQDNHHNNFPNTCSLQFQTASLPGPNYPEHCIVECTSKPDYPSPLSEKLKEVIANEACTNNNNRTDNSQTPAESSATLALVLFRKMVILSAIIFLMVVCFVLMQESIRSYNEWIESGVQTKNQIDQFRLRVFTSTSDDLDP